MKIATWNVNSIKSRLPHVTAYLKEVSPDVLLLQELKSLEENVPRTEIEDLGYNLAIVGQKTYNGVAIVSKHPIEIEQRGLPGDSSDEQARYMEAIVGNVRIASIYLPNGNPIDTEKFPYKLAWLDRLISHVRTLLTYEETLVLGGDYNVCPTDDDVYDPDGWAGDALCHPETRTRFRTLSYLGLTDALRAQRVGVALRWLRAEKSLDHVPILVYSGSTEELESRRAEIAKLNADSQTKPLQADALLQFGLYLLDRGQQRDKRGPFRRFGLL